MFTPVKLDKMRNFRYGMVAIDKIEKSLGQSISNMDLDDLTMHQASVIIWAGLVHEDKELTPERVMELVDDHSSLVDVLEKMSTALADGFSGGKSTPKN